MSVIEWNISLNFYELCYWGSISSRQRGELNQLK